MPNNTLGSIAHVLTTGLTGYDEGEQENMRRLVALAAQKRQQEQQDEERNLRRISALSSAAANGLTIDPASPLNSQAQRPTSPEGGRTARVGGPADLTPEPGIPAPDATPIGRVGEFNVSIPRGGLVDKAARADQAKRSQAVAERRAHIKAYNDTLPNGHLKKLSDQQIDVVANDDALYNEYGKSAAGLGPARNIDPNSAEGIQAAIQKELAVKRALHKEGLDKQPTEPNWQIVQTDKGIMQVNPKDARMRPVLDEQGQPVTPKLPGSIQTKIVENKRSVKVIDDALREIQLHPDAVGFKRGRVDAIDQRVDPEGVNARAAIADVGSLLLHTRSGAAITVSEYPRLAPFVPKATDSYQTVVKKLNRLKELAEMETSYFENGGVDAATPVQASSSPTTKTAGPPVKTRPAVSQGARPDVKALRAKYGLE